LTLPAGSAKNQPVVRTLIVGVALALTAAARADGPQPTLTATVQSGVAPLPTALDPNGSVVEDGQTVALHLVFPGNGDIVPVPPLGSAVGYTYTLPGFDVASSWLLEAPSGKFASSRPVGIMALRLRDGLAAPTVTTVVAATTEPGTLAFSATVTPAMGDVEIGRRWQFGDGAESGQASPLHHYERPGLYQGRLVVTTRAGLLARSPLLVVVAGDAAPPLVAGVTPGDARPRTPLKLVAYVVGAGLAFAGAEVDWPDLADVAPQVTATATGLTLTSTYDFAAAGAYDVPVALALVGQPQPLRTIAHVMVANPDGSAPSPVLMATPAPRAIVGQPYAPDDSGAVAPSLLIAGNGPFAFGVAAPSPRNFGVDDGGVIHWTPTREQLGTQRLALQVTDADGRQATFSWVVAVVEPSSGCAAAPGAPARSSPWLLLPLVLVWARRWSRISG
jgi:PKD repeat protein